MSQVEWIGYQKEADELRQDWERIRIINQYLKRRTARTGSKNPTAQFFSNLGFPEVKEEHIEFLRDHAEKRALKEQKKIGMWKRGRNALTKTPHEKIFISKLESAFKEQFGTVEPRGIKIYPRAIWSGIKRGKVAIGRTFPDVVVLGLRPSKATKSTGFGGASKKTQWVGTVVEVNGECHNYKSEADLFNRKLWEELGLFTVDYLNEEISSHDFKSTRLTPLIDNFVSGYAQPIRRETIEKFHHKLDLLNIASYLTLNEMDELIRSAFGIDLHLQQGLRALQKSKKSPRMFLRV